MNAFLRVFRQLRQIALMIALLIVLPAYLFDVHGTWQVGLLCVVYALFLIGSVWNTIRYGQFSQKQDDPEARKALGGITYFFQIVGLWGVHWLAIFDFSRMKSLTLLLTDTVSLPVSILFLATATFIIHISTRTLGKFFDRLTVKKDHALVTTGIYGVVRHPVYLSYLVLFFGGCLLLQSLWGLVLLLVAGGITFGNHIRVEEAMLEKKFGAEFLGYKKKTKKLIPFLY
ncbi:MAG: isoprenylcysteine carboxylmethyltransferase family protein [Chlorobiales bacterium]|nr:isoprenylcysteine carboxylmethyltransferase family protein [Chlorobiales bacterium]